MIRATRKFVAQNKDCLTVGELREFVDALYAAGVSDSAKLLAANRQVIVVEVQD